MLDQPFMTDIIEASSISHMPQVIDIYSASWGPTDNGKTVDGPRELTLQAMADGVNKVTKQFLSSGCRGRVICTFLCWNQSVTWGNRMQLHKFNFQHISRLFDVHSAIF